MKWKNLLAITATAALCATTSVKADHDAWDFGSRVRYDANNAEKFTANELTFDAYAAYRANERRLGSVFATSVRHGTWGGGVGVNYFFTRNLGIGGDAIILDNGGNFVDNVSGNLIFRFPIDSVGIAPYIFGGAGRNFDPTYEWEGHVGTGVEFRLNHNTGIFADVRYVWPDKSGTDGIGFRSGLRLAF